MPEFDHSCARRSLEHAGFGLPNDRSLPLQNIWSETSNSACHLQYHRSSSPSIPDPPLQDPNRHLALTQLTHYTSSHRSASCSMQLGLPALSPPGDGAASAPGNYQLQPEHGCRCWTTWHHRGCEHGDSGHHVAVMSPCLYPRQFGFYCRWHDIPVSPGHYVSNKDEDLHNDLQHSSGFRTRSAIALALAPQATAATCMYIMLVLADSDRGARVAPSPCEG